MTTLEAYEADIEKYESAYQNAARALLAIHIGDLWAEHYFSFFDYCERRWGFRKSQSNRLLNAGRLLLTLESSPAGDLPPTERSIRPLMKVKAWRQERGHSVYDEEATWQKRAEAWRIVRDQADGEAITEEFVASVVDQRYLGQKSPSKEKLDAQERARIWRAINVLADTKMTPKQLIGSAYYTDMGPSGIGALAYLEKLRDLIV